MGREPWTEAATGWGSQLASFGIYTARHPVGRSELGAGKVIDARTAGTSGPLEPAKGMWPFFPCRSQCQSESGAVPRLGVLKDISELL